MLAIERESLGGDLCHSLCRLFLECSESKVSPDYLKQTMVWDFSFGGQEKDLLLAFESYLKRLHEEKILTDESLFHGALKVVARLRAERDALLLLPEASPGG